MRDVRRSRVQQRMYCSKADKKGVWSELKKQAEEAANVEVDEADVSPEMIPKTFKEYLQYCKIIGTLDMPAVLSKEGQPSSAVGVMEALDELHMLHLVKDDELFYLILVGWGADLAKYRFRVFNRAEREKSFKELLQWVVKIESLGHKEVCVRSGFLACVFSCWEVADPFCGNERNISVPIPGINLLNAYVEIVL